MIAHAVSSFTQNKNIMRKTILLLTCMSFVLLTSAQNRTKIDTQQSIIKWTGSNLFKYNKHYGTVAFLNGEVINYNDGSIGGSFEINMNSITNTDGAYNELLVEHLKNADFFDVKKHPISKLKIISTTRKSDNNIGVIAELTIKGVTNKINFDSKLEFLNGKSIMTSKFIIDRTLWGIDYESKGLFGSLKDNVISDAIEFEVIVEWPGGGC